jgi:RHS repeat-associated protein
MSVSALPGSNEILTFTNGGTTELPLLDRTGSTIALVNSSGSIATQYTYDPYRKITRTGQASAYPFGIAGMFYDTGSNLYGTFGRWYEPYIQQFVSEDPLRCGGGNSNLYAYVHNDPINRMDLLGMDDGDCDSENCPPTPRQKLFARAARIEAIHLLGQSFRAGRHRS